MNGNETKANTATDAIVTTPTKRASLRMRTQQQQMTEINGASPTNHKRPSTLDSSINKRLKGNSTVSSFNQSGSSSGSKSNIAQQQQQQQQQSYSSQENVQQHQKKSPHLLQHLMAPSPDRVRKYNGPACKDTSNEKSACSDTQWACNGPGGYDETMKNQSSGSVLKNLLVSGCDLSAGYVCHVPVRMRKLAKA